MTSAYEIIAYAEYIPKCDLNKNSGPIRELERQEYGRLLQDLRSNTWLWVFQLKSIHSSHYLTQRPIKPCNIVRTNHVVVCARY